MKNQIIAFSYMLLISCFQPAASCDDFACLANDSINLYEQNPQLWWDIYRDTSLLAKDCKSVDEVAKFLMLWAGEVDGELAQAYYDDTDFVIQNHPSCFFKAFKKSTENVQAGFFSKWCPKESTDSLKKTNIENENDELTIKLLGMINQSCD